MRNLFALLSFLMLLLSSSAQAQTVVEDARAMSQGTNNGFTLLAEGLEEGDLENVLKNFLKDVKSRKSPKYDRRNQEFFVDDAEWKALSANTVDVYVGHRQTGNLQHEVTFWFDLGGAYLSSEDHGDAAAYVREEMMPELHLAVYNEMVALELQKEEDQLKAMNKDYDKLAKEKKKLEDLIEECKQKIEQAEKDLKDNAAAQAEMMKNIEGQQTVIEEVKKKMKKN